MYCISSDAFQSLAHWRSACGVGEWVGCLWASRVHEHGGHRWDHQEDDDEAGKPLNAAGKEVTSDERDWNEDLCRMQEWMYSRLCPTYLSEPHKTYEKPKTHIMSGARGAA